MAMLCRSELPEPVLSAIWSSVISSPNAAHLSRSEFYSCLVLIALAQKNMTIADLSALPSLPIPHLSPVHPLFTETNAKADDDLILFDAADSKPSPTASVEKGGFSGDLDLAAMSPKPACSLRREDLVPCWERVIDAASELFSAVQQTNSKMLDAFYTERGHLYLQSLYAIQQIIQRIHRAASECNSNADLVSRCEILTGVWCNLYGLLDSDRVPLEKRRELQRTEHWCNICGAQTNIDNTHFEPETQLTFHVSCANFWLHQVGSLPGK
ncbi:EPS15-like proteiny (EH) domain and EF-hand domain pair-containing protein [Aphelenchoides fujianensis]|nr:EPS15-like proteiny (EH) domain and EF-hand domain pair-containing protein [Aphelenchoides fujianensis]